MIFIVNNQEPAELDRVLFITLDYAIAKYGINIRDLDDHIPNTGFNNIWLQFPNRDIERLAFQIVDRDDSNDTKMRKIATWVINNIGYLSDEENYGYEELWAPLRPPAPGWGNLREASNETSLFNHRTLKCQKKIPVEDSLPRASCASCKKPINDATSQVLSVPCCAERDFTPQI